jgi:nucleoside 2-deoxyribosyltransferase
MAKCFVIQPFDDGGKFDKRYEDVLAPAIKAAELEPYRVDRDPTSSIPIDTIAAQISASAMCLCDITTDNPNVWFELGYAIAQQKDVVLICSKERTTPFPFDVRHRSIIRYATDSSRDFDELRIGIRDRLVAQLEKRTALESVGTITSVAKVEGLEQFEIAALVAVAKELEGPRSAVTAFVVRNDMETAGFNKLAAMLGLRSLLDKGLLETSQIVDAEYEHAYDGYAITAKGIQWLFDNRDGLTLRTEPPAAKSPSDQSPSDEDIPF